MSERTDRSESTPSPPAIKFVAIRNQVMRGALCVAVASSSTSARRIANALNLYVPNQKGY